MCNFYVVTRWSHKKDCDGSRQKNQTLISSRQYIVNFKNMHNKKAFQYDAYHPLGNHMSFGGLQMSVPVVALYSEVKWRSLSLAGAGTGAGGVCCLISVRRWESPCLHVWKGVRPGGACTMRSNASWVMVTWDSPSPTLYPTWTDRYTCENITFPQRHCTKYQCNLPCELEEFLYQF